MKRFLALLAVAVGVCANPAQADEVTVWTLKMFEAAKAANTSPLNMTRNAAIVHAAMFDAINGVRPRYESVHVEPNEDATEGASARAAAVQAAYVTLVKLYPAQKVGILDPQLAASLGGIVASADAIAKGVAWGQTVGDAIWAFAETDGFNVVPPPYAGGTALGEWRSLANPPANGVGLQFPGMRPWVLRRASQFRPDPPPSLRGRRYAIDFNETQRQTILVVANPTSDEARNALFWNAGTASQLWQGALVSLANAEGLSLTENARLFARMSLSMADAAIGCWEAKYRYKFWRPVTAVAFADQDGNPHTSADPDFTTTLFTTPNHPEYPSGHSCLSGAAAEVLADQFGKRTDFDVVTDRLFNPDGTPVTQSYSSAADALEAVVNARVDPGIHFRTACEEGQRLGRKVAGYVLEHALRRLRGHGHGHGHSLEQGAVD